MVCNSRTEVLYNTTIKDTSQEAEIINTSLRMFLYKVLLLTYNRNFPILIPKKGTFYQLPFAFHQS